MSARAGVLFSVALVACTASADRNAASRPAAVDTAHARAVEATTSPHADTARERAASGTASTAADSVRGIIESVGSEPKTQLILRRHDRSSCAVTASFGARTTAALAGLEVTLWGAQSNAAPPMVPGTSCAVHATRFAVRAADGVPAVDGILRRDGAGFTLELARGDRRALRGVPAVLRAHVGARIFWAGPLDRAPAAYGVLAEPPR